MTRIEGVEALAARPLAAAARDLPVAGADIVSGGRPQHMVQSLVGAEESREQDVAAAPIGVQDMPGGRLTGAFIGDVQVQEFG